MFDTGVIGMLGASDYDNMDMISPFIGALIDTCCGTTEEAPDTESFTQYLDLTDFIYSRSAVTGWIQEEFKKLTKLISSLKSVARNTFTEYPPSGMGTCKWNYLEHILKRLRELGGLEHLHGGLYEMSHEIFKDDYKLISKRKNSAMLESLQRQEEMELQTVNSPVVISPVERTTNMERVRVVKEDGAIVVKRGRSLKIHEVEVERTVKFQKRHNRESHHYIPAAANDLLPMLGTDGTYSFIKLLYEKLLQFGVT